MDIQRTVYVPDRIKRKSTYKGDYVDYKKQSKVPTGTRQNSKQKQRQQSPKKVVGGKKEGKKMEEKLNNMSECFVCKSFSFELGGGGGGGTWVNVC